MPTQVQRTASARRRLIAAATSLVAEQGVGNTSVAAIGERAGMSRGAVNFHFGSKDDLLTAVAAEVTADWEERTFQHDLPEGLDFAAGLGVVLEGFRNELESEPERHRIFAMLFFEALGPSPHLHEHFAGLHRRVRSRLAETLSGLQSTGQVRADLEPEAFAVLVMGLFRGVTFQYLLDPGSVDLAAAYDEARDLLLARLTL